MDDSNTPMGRAANDLAQAIVDAVSVPGTWSDLVSGALPPGIAQKASIFASARANAAKAAARGVTASLALWRQAIAELQATHGRNPTVSELARHRWKSTTAAQYAITRLREMDMYPELPKRDEM